MIGTNLAALRKAKKISQEELAVRVNVVRQTISKWEKGLSVPDADMLVKLAEALDVSTEALLGEADVSPKNDTENIAEQLSRLNEQLAVRNRRSRLIWKTVLWVVLGGTLATIVLSCSGACVYTAASTVNETSQVEISQVPSEDDFAHAPAIEVSEGVLQACTAYAQSLGYEAGSFQKAVVLGEAWLPYGYCEDRAKEAMLDSGDYVVIFEHIRCVVDAETGTVLGRIPFV